jgi:hypothetical protein
VPSGVVPLEIHAALFDTKMLIDAVASVTASHSPERLMESVTERYWPSGHSKQFIVGSIPLHTEHSSGHVDHTFDSIILVTALTVIVEKVPVVHALLQAVAVSLKKKPSSHTSHVRLKAHCKHSPSSQGRVTWLHEVHVLSVELNTYLSMHESQT